MWDELGISAGTAVLILISLYFVIKWAVKNGIKEAYSAIKITIAVPPLIPNSFHIIQSSNFRFSFPPIGN